MTPLASYLHCLQLPIRCGQNCLNFASIATVAAVKPKAPAGSHHSVKTVEAKTNISDPLAWQPPKGATVEKSLQVADFFQVDRLVSKRQLFEHRVHLGHKASCRGEWMTPHLFGSRCGVDIIDLEQTAPLMRRALNFTAHVSARGGIVLFFWQGWPALASLVERRVKDMGEFVHTRPWLEQSLTDSENYFATATRLPDLAVFLSCMSPVMLPHPAIATCAKVMIPTVGICDSNADPRLVTYPVPGNDDSPTAIRLYLAYFAEAVRRGKAAFTQWSAPPPDSSDSAQLDAPEFRRFQLEALQYDSEPNPRKQLDHQYDNNIPRARLSQQQHASQQRQQFRSQQPRDADNFIPDRLNQRPRQQRRPDHEHDSKNRDWSEPVQRPPRKP